MFYARQTGAMRILLSHRQGGIRLRWICKDDVPGLPREGENYCA